MLSRNGVSGNPGAVQLEGGNPGAFRRVFQRDRADLPLSVQLEQRVFIEITRLGVRPIGGLAGPAIDGALDPLIQNADAIRPGPRKAS